MTFRFRRSWFTLLFQFFVGQGATQLINLVVGLLLLRWLSVAAYAQVSVAFAFQSTLGILVDLGFSGSIVALVGDRAMDPKVVGNYLRSARHFRTRTLLFVALAAVVAFPLVTSRQPWPLSTKALLFGSILVTLYFQGLSLYSAPLLIHRRLQPYYRAQVISAVVRTVLCGGLYVLGWLTAWATSWTGAVVTAVSGLLYRKAARPFLAEPEHSDPECNREMLRYLGPLIPGAVFSAFQGSISTALITIFGHTGSIAEVAALGRLAQLFLIFTTLNSVVVGPYIARSPRERLALRYAAILVGLVALAFGLWSIARLFPGTLLLLLGPKYQHLHVEVAWIVAVGGVEFISSGMWAMNSARKWLFWWGSIAYITVLLTTQVTCISIMDLSQTLNVLHFSLITSVSVLCIHIATAIYGFRYGEQARSTP